jgi:phosphate transport system protein
MHHPLVKPMVDIPKMASLVQSMLLRCLDAFVSGDTEVARNVLLADDEVDPLRCMRNCWPPCSAIPG